MIIKEITSEQFAGLDEQVFTSAEWLSLYGEELKPHGIFSDSGQLIGGFVFAVERKASLIRFYRNPAYNPTINLVASFQTKNKAKLHSEHKRLMELLADFFDTHRGHMLSICLPGAFMDLQPFIWKGFKVIPQYTYVIDLEPAYAVIEKNFSRDRRYDIKKALKDGVECHRADSYEEVKALVMNTFERKNKGVDEEMLDRILFRFANPENSFAFVSTLEGKAISASFFVHDKNRVYYLLGGYHKELKHSGAGALSISYALKHAQQLGLKEFDFEGSMLPEVERYFRGFGGDMRTFYSINKANILLELALKFIDRSKF